MRPCTEVLPTRRIGASDNGALNDILINIRVSLTVGRRWRTAPASHAPAGADEFAACANRSAGAASAGGVAAVPRRNSRQLDVSMVSPGWCLQARVDKG